MVSSRDKVSAGQPFEPPTAAFNNAIVDHLIGHPNRNQASPRHIGPSQVEVWVTHSAAIAAGQPVGLGDPQLLVVNAADATHPPVFSRRAPTRGCWAIAQRGILADGVDRAILTGVAWAQVTVANESHTHVDIVSNALQSTFTGWAKILYKPAGVGTHWCCLYLGCCGSGSTTALEACEHTANGIPEPLPVFMSGVVDQGGNPDDAAAFNALHEIPKAVAFNCRNELVVNTVSFQITMRVTAISDTQWEVRFLGGGMPADIVLLSNPSNPPPLVGGKIDAEATYSDFVLQGTDSVNPFPLFGGSTITLNP